MKYGILSFKVNNYGVLSMRQNVIDGTVTVYRLEKNKGYQQIAEIPAGDMVMLVNLYTHIKENDRQNDFINPHGKNKDTF